MSTTPDLPPLPEPAIKPVYAAAGMQFMPMTEQKSFIASIPVAYYTVSQLEAYAREAVRLDHASRVGANLLCAYGCASEAQDPANRKPCPWWCGDTSKCAASPLTELKWIHGEMVRCGYMEQDYCGKPWAGEHNAKMRKWQARFDELLALLLASAPITPPDEATSRDAERYRWLCQHPDWHFIEAVCREFAADSSFEFYERLSHVIDTRRSIELGAFEEHQAIAARTQGDAA